MTTLYAMHAFNWDAIRDEDARDAAKNQITKRVWSTLETAKEAARDRHEDLMDMFELEGQDRTDLHWPAEKNEEGQWVAYDEPTDTAYIVQEVEVLS